MVASAAFLALEHSTPSDMVLERVSRLSRIGFVPTLRTGYKHEGSQLL